MAKGQKRSNREIKKPKQDKKNKKDAAVSAVTESFQRGAAKKPSGAGKK